RRRHRRRDPPRRRGAGAAGPPRAAGAPLMFVELPSRAHRTRHWAAPLLAAIAIAGYVAWLTAADPAAFLQRWGLQSGLATNWRTLLAPSHMATPVTSLFL